MEPGTVAGIDVSKGWLDAVIRPDGTHRRVDKTETGWTALASWFGECGVRVVVGEATGGYERGVHRALAVAGIGVHVGNPWQVRGFMQSQGMRAKSDKLDAGWLARYAEQVQPASTTPPTVPHGHLAALLTRRRHLRQMLPRKRRGSSRRSSPPRSRPMIRSSQV